MIDELRLKSSDPLPTLFITTQNKINEIIMVLNYQIPNPLSATAVLLPLAMKEAQERMLLKAEKYDRTKQALETAKAFVKEYATDDAGREFWDEAIRQIDQIETGYPPEGMK